MRISTIVGKDDLIKAKLEEGYSFQLLSKELGVGCHTLINYVKGLDTCNSKKYQGISFRKPLTLRDLAKAMASQNGEHNTGFRKGVSRAEKWDSIG